LIGKILRSKATGVAETNRPLGSFLFLGPTGVGKTETAKVLSKVYYGEHSPILRFDMAEYAGEEGLPRLIGSQVTNQPGVLTTAIKNRPASLLLLDEIEKAPPQISNLFLSLLDEGVITDAFGRKINCQHLFVIATSNAGSEYIRQAVTQGTDREDLQNSVVNHVLEQGIFSPEFINRFDGVVVYEPLKPEHLELVARLLLDELAKNMQRKSIYLEFSPAAVTKLAREGYEPAFGARPMRRIIEVNLGDLIGKALLADEIKEGDSLKIEPAEGSKLFRLTKTS
jgi:ATP-dependent Clp protease ATP-binding subunit ClpA